MKTDKSKRRYVLLDRDGTIMIDKNYQKDPTLTELLPNAALGLKTLSDAGWGLVLVTNQSGIARGLLAERDLAAVNASLQRLLAEKGAHLDAIYFCPHVPEDNCDCRKPLPGMAKAAAKELGFSLADCVVIGDRPCDIELGRAVGGTAVLVRTGGGKETEQDGRMRADYVADDLLDAGRWIVANVWPGLDATGIGRC